MLFTVNSVIWPSDVKSAGGRVNILRAVSGVHAGSSSPDKNWRERPKIFVGIIVHKMDVVKTDFR